MSTSNRWFEVILRITVLVIFVVSSLAPAGVQARPVEAANENFDPPPQAGFKGGAVRSSLHSFSSRAAYQAETPTPTETPIPGASSTPEPTSTPEASPTSIPSLPVEFIESVDQTVSADAAAFSTAMIANTSGANVLLYDSPYPDLFTGRARFSIPIWTPPGRNGMAPPLSLSYSSSTINGILGDVQAPWAGMGWNIDTIEIAREITNGGCDPCGGGSYGYENNFVLLINGTGYELIADGITPGRYHTKIESFLYIQLHNDDLGNNTPAAQNASGEWWEVVQRDGTRWRLGWNADSEQLAAMAGYPGAASGTWVSLGYAGHATDVVSFRWRADRVADTHGNHMGFAYFEENRNVAGTSANYDRASYLDEIIYTGHTSGNPAPGYSVLFVRESRGGSDEPPSPADWDNWDTYRLDRIEVKHGANIVRTYDLGYDVRSYSDDGVAWQTTVLTSLGISGGAESLPVMSFGYVDLDNRADCGLDCQKWAYPRLASVSSGWGSTAAYTYGNDGRPNTSWYNWRLETLDVADGVNPNPMKTVLAYSSPCYSDPLDGWCSAGNTGELIGYGGVTTTIKDFDGATTLGSSIHQFHTDEQKAGREYEVQNQNASGAVLSQASTTFTVSTGGLPSEGFFTYASAVEAFLNPARVSRAEYVYDTSTGNLTSQKEFDGALTLYRQMDYEYVTDASPSVWILNAVSRRILKDAAGTPFATQEFGYDGGLPGSGSPSAGELTLSRQVDGAQTIDTAFDYDPYGNLIEIRLYEDYGAVGVQPVGTYLTYSIAYDTNLRTHAVSVINPLSHVIQRDYDFGLGLPTSVTDPNNNSTTSAYDGLGRVTAVTYPGYIQPNVKYTYAAPPVSAPFAVRTEVWDEPAGLYRAAWQILDGLGRAIQTQSPYETAGNLVLSDTSYNAQGLALFSGLPRTLSSAGGSYLAPNWGSVPHTTTGYDALGRPASVAYADGSAESYSYSGLRTAKIDRNAHQKVQENDAFGRLVKVEEYLGSGTYTLYATTTYQYDPRSLLTQVTDAAASQTTIHYNGFGRKDSMTDSDMGTWSYAYDTFGNLTGQTDARGCVTAVTYDDLNRPTGKTFSGPGACATMPPVTYTYDSRLAGNEGLGRRTGMSDGSGSTAWFYNQLGQVENLDQTIDGANYQLDLAFDAFNRPLTQTLPSGETLNYGYNAMGALASLSGTDSYVSQIHYSASGQAADLQSGNGLLQQYCYDANTLRLTGIRAYSGALQACGTSPSAPKLDLTYSYQPNGNVSQMVDATQNETTNYTYDELDRLLSVSGPYNKNYAYNTSGNIDSITTAPTLIAVTAGGDHSCALTISGGVKCWGYNEYGQLGDGTTTDNTAPVDVTGLTSGVIAISAGGYHTCALTTSGGVKCWGDNANGQLGDGTTTHRSTPVDVSGLTSGVKAITAGGFYTCALTTNGEVKCWGHNWYSQLGDGTNKDRTIPVNVEGLSTEVSAVDAAGSHTCALTVGGGVKCWGENGNGQLGDGTTKNRKTPVDVSGLSSGVAAITARGKHTCAVTTSGGAKCWGDNANGKLGDGTTTDRTVPVVVIGLTSGVKSIKAGGYHTCALTTNGEVKCWGLNTSGQLGDGTTIQHITPINVSGLTNGVAAITAGYNRHACALTMSGKVKCWGDNSDGQLGNGSSGGYSTTPVDTNFSTINGYSYDGHAVTALSSGETYTYDENGNMIERLEDGLIYYQTFDAENRLVSVTVGGQTTQFMYDGDGNLVKKIKPDGSSTTYIRGIYEVDKSSSGITTRTVTYYPAGGAMRIDNSVYYVLKDRLGSAYATTDSSGNVVGEMRYFASGETRMSTGNMFTDRLFTGQREIAGLGIYQFGARFYSPELMRFLSADSVVPDVTNPQAFNRYSYAMNNPVRYSDPTGHMICEDGPCTPSTSGGVGGIIFPNNGNGGEGGDDGSANNVLVPPQPISSTLDVINTTGTGSDVADILYSLGSIAQDLATFGDVLFVVGTTAVITVGCFAGPAGCLAAAVEAEVAYLSGYNQVLNLLSLGSFVLTVGADFADDGQLGENSATSLVSTAFGSVALDPYSSAAFNVYGSGYNHGYFNGVITLMNGGPLIKEK